MGTFLAFVKTAFKARFAYRSSVFFGSVLSFVHMIVQIALWRFVFLEEPDMVRYMTAYVVISRMLRYVYRNQISSAIGEKVRTGDFVTDLIKPANSVLIYWSTSFGQMLAGLATRGLPVLLIFSPVLLSIEWSLMKILTFFFVCIIDYILVNLIFTLLGYLAFIVMEIWPFVRSMENTMRFLSGAIIPIALFPPWLASATKFLPFPLLYSFPIKILLEDLPQGEMVENLLLLGGWTVLLFIVFVIVHKRAIWHSEVQGG